MLSFYAKFHAALHAYHAVLLTLTSKLSLQTQSLQTFQNVTMQTPKHNIKKKPPATILNLFSLQLIDSPLPISLLSSLR